MRLLFTPWSRAFLILAVGVAAFGGLAWVSRADPGINFLPSGKEAHWIVFPFVVHARPHRIITLDTVFRREFTLEHPISKGALRLRAAKRAELKVNGTPVELQTGRNWKTVSGADVGALLKTGKNVIEARVFNDDAPPAISLILYTDDSPVGTDSSWQASFAGSAWRDAAIASQPRVPGRGNPMTGSETTGRALLKIWPFWLAFAGAGLALVALAYHWCTRNKREPPASGELSRQTVVALLLVLASLWMALFWNNSARLPFHAGFDWRAHLNYIKYIQERHALPLPNEGFEMFQPPLYYVLSAGVLSACQLSSLSAAAVPVLRGLTMACGMAQFILVFLNLRLLFPGQAGSQLVGLLLAAFLPMQLYLSHYTTNETLAALTVTASIYFTLRILTTKECHTSQHIWLGLFLGAAMLTKSTAVLLIPPLALALAVKLAKQRSSFGDWLRTFGAVSVVAFAVCGWHYARIWHHFDTPFIGNWDAPVGFLWWQDPGYHTAGDYLRFGRSLVSPVFSSFAGLADGIYSTLWGDALCAGSPDITYRVPWNYELMAAGYLLAVVPSVMILTGAVIALCRYIREPSSTWLLLLGFSGAVVLGVVFMSLRVASYAQIKAFYGLAALVPLCAFGATGWNVLTRGNKVFHLALGTILLVCAMNNFASYWIRPSTTQRLYSGRRMSLDQKMDAALSEGEKAVALDPSNADAQGFLASMLGERGRLAEAIRIEQAIEPGSQQSSGHFQYAQLLLKQGECARAIEESRRALELGPENWLPYAPLLTCLTDSERNAEAIEAARAALAADPYTANFHYNLGMALARQGDLIGAANQFTYTLLIQPDWTEASANLHLAILSVLKESDAAAQLHQVVATAPESPNLFDELAWLFATHPDARLRNGDEAIRLAKKAWVMTGKKTPALLTTLAAAYAEAGKFQEATTTAQKALSLAKSLRAADDAKLSQDLLTLFQANRAYREDPSGN